MGWTRYRSPQLKALAVMKMKLPVLEVTYDTAATYDEIAGALEGKIHEYSPINRPTPLKGIFTKNKVRLCARSHHESSGQDFNIPMICGRCHETNEGTALKLFMIPISLPI